MASTKMIRLTTMGSGAVIVCSGADLPSQRGAEAPRKGSSVVPLRLCVSSWILFFCDDLTRVADQRRLHDLVVARELPLAGLQVQRQREEIENVARVERGRVGGDPGRQIGRADDLHDLPAADLARLRPFD